MVQLTIDIDAETKSAFEAAFAGQDLSAVVGSLLRQAIQERATEAAALARRQAAVEAVLNG